jgi:hypothetical protein
MASKTLQFEVDPGDTVAQWLTVDDQDVPLVNHKGSVDVDDGLPKHTLTWWFTGDSGTKIEIKGTLAGNPNTVVIDVKSSIPPGEHDGGGRRRFTLTPKAD